MNRNDVTTAENLITGDIFYKQGDAKKTKLQVHEKQHARIICVSPDLEKHLRGKEFLQKWIKPTQPVIFLRRTQLTDIGDPALLLPGEKALAS